MTTTTRGVQTGKAAQAGSQIFNIQTNNNLIHVGLAYVQFKI